MLTNGVVSFEQPGPGVLVGFCECENQVPMRQALIVFRQLLSIGVYGPVLVLQLCELLVSCHSVLILFSLLVC